MHILYTVIVTFPKVLTRRVFIVRIIWSNKLPVCNETTASSAQCTTTAGMLHTIRIIVVIRLLRQRSEKYLNQQYAD